LPNAKQVAVFDTAFHQTMPDWAFRYAVPAAWYRELGVRKYGFHGTSHLYVSKRAAAMLGKPASECNIISLHIGSGASACAIKNGKCLDTSMGLTPLTGLMMGTRPGDMDPGIIPYVMERLGLTVEQIQTHLTKQSGVLGVTECYADLRDIEANMDKNDACRLAFDMDAASVRKYVGQYMAELGHVDAIVWTAGVGENSELMRAAALNGMEEFGIKLDAAINDKTHTYASSGETVISAPDSKIKVFMIPTNEELVMIEDTIAVANGTYDPDHLAMDYSFSK
jgi:acetate kinase